MFTADDFFIGSLLRPGAMFQRQMAVNPAILQPQPVEPTEDTIRSQGYAPPYVGPHSLDNYGQETDEMRRAYRDFHRKEPAVRSAIEGLVASIADTDIAVIPDDEDHPDDCRAAELVQWTVENSPHGWDGLIRRVLLAGLIDGYSVGEIVLQGIENHRKWGGYWGLRHVKNKDTDKLRLRVDVYNNVLGVVNTVRGLATYPSRKVMLFTHADVYDNPHGASELRAAYRACRLIDNAYKLWDYALRASAGPFLRGKVGANERRKRMQEALAEARAGGFIVIPKDDEVDVVNLASATSFDAFERKIDKLREEIYMAIRGAYLPFMQGTGGGGDTRGSAGVSKGAGSDPRERVISKSIGRVISQQLCPSLVVPNFGARCGIPRVVLGGVDWGETKTQLDVADTLLNKFRVPVSKSWLYRSAQIPPPTSDEDALQPQVAPLPTANPFQFAAPGPPPRPGLVWKEETKRWVRPDTGEDHEGPSSGGSNNPAPGNPTPSVTQGVNVPPEAHQKIGSRLERAKLAVAGLLYRVDSLVPKAQAAMEAVFDTPEDLAKGYYTPAMGTVSGKYDAVSAELGISTNMLGVVMTRAVPALASYVVGKIRGRNKLSAFASGGEIDAAADVLCDIYAVVAESMGFVDGMGLVNRDAIREMVAKRMNDKSEGGPGDKPGTFPAHDVR